MKVRMTWDRPSDLPPDVNCVHPSGYRQGLYSEGGRDTLGSKFILFIQGLGNKLIPGLSSDLIPESPIQPGPIKEGL